VRRFAEDLALEPEIVTEAKAGIANAEVGRFVTIATPDDAPNLHRRAMARLQARLADDRASALSAGHAEDRIDTLLPESAHRWGRRAEAEQPQRRLLGSRAIPGVAELQSLHLRSV
jgi:hypothetical protein